MSSILDYETALLFLEKVGVMDGEERSRSDPLSFLNDLIAGFQEHVPFQCVSILAQTSVEKHVPTLEEVVEAGMSLEGGVCFTLNTFMCILLQTLHFNAHVVDGSYSAFGDTHNHVVVLLSDLRFAGDDYIIDVGSGFPFQDPLPLSELPCTRNCAGNEYKYEWSDQMIHRLHRAGDEILKGEKPVMHGEWRQVFHIDLHPVSFDHFRPYMENIYTDSGICDFHTSLRAVRFPPSRLNTVENDEQYQSPEFKAATKDGRIMIAFKNQSLLEGPMDKALKTRISTEEWADKIKEKFPTIPSCKVDLAIQNMIDMAKCIE